MHNLYPLRYEQAVHAATAAARGDGRTELTVPRDAPPAVELVP
jgi:hypothetical protein